MLSDREKKILIEKNWRLEDVPEVPFLIEVGPFHGATTQYHDDDEAELAWNVDFHNRRKMVDDYGMPNIKPNQGINIVAAAFGCECTVNDEADPWVRSIIREENVKDVYALRVPDVKTNPVFERARKRVEYFQEKSSLPLRLVNVPSPMVTASLIWEYTSFIEGTLVYPDEAHALMEKVTEATIAYVKAQLEWIRNLHTMGHEMWYIPREVGVRISDDTAVLMSPNLYREFGVRYNSIISRAFGGIVVHSCGDVQNVVASMMETEGIRGIDVTIPQNPRWDVIRDAVCGKAALNLRHYYWDHQEDANINLADYSQKLVEYFGRRGIFIQTSTAEADEAEALGKRLHEILSE